MAYLITEDGSSLSQRSGAVIVKMIVCLGQLANGAAVSGAVDCSR